MVAPRGRVAMEMVASVVVVMVEVARAVRAVRAVTASPREWQPDFACVSGALFSFRKYRQPELPRDA